MKKINYLLLSLTALVLALSSCSSDIDKPPVPGEITDLVLPSTTIQQGSNVVIQGVGFEKNAEIWLRPQGVLESSDQDVKARILNVTASGITFVAPDVYSNQSLVMKLYGQEYLLGTLVFAPKIALNKRIVKSNFSMNNKSIFDFAYDTNNKLKSVNEKEKDGTTWKYSYIYNTTGQLVSVKKANAANVVIIEEGYEYMTTTSIKLTTRDESGVEPLLTEAILTLNAKGQIVKKEASSTNYSTYAYDAAGNMTKLEQYVDATLTNTHTFKYDTNKSVLTNQGVPVWYWVSNATAGLYLFAGANNALEANDGVDVFLFSYDRDSDLYTTVQKDASTNTKIGEFSYEVIQ